VQRSTGKLAEVVLLQTFFLNNNLTNAHMLTPLYSNDVSVLHKGDPLRAEICRSVTVRIKVLTYVHYGFLCNKLVIRFQENPSSIS